MSNGETLLTQVIKENNNDLCVDIMEAKYGLEFLTMANKCGKLPIYVAIDEKAYDIIHDIILESMTMDLKDADDLSPADHIFKILNETLAEKEERKIINQEQYVR